MKVKRKRWTPEENRRLRQMVNSLMIAEEIGKVLGRTSWSVLCQCHRLGIRIKSKPRYFRTAWSAKSIAMLRASFAEGKTLPSIAKDCSKPLSSVLRAIRKLGLERSAGLEGDVSRG
jgi:hypothetical protein